METKVINFSNLQTNLFELEKTTSRMNLSEVFADRGDDTYLNEFTLYIALFNTIPNFINEIKIDCKKANIWSIENFRAEIKDCYYNKIYFKQNKSAELDDIFYFLYEDLIVDFDTNSSIVRFLFRTTDIKKIE